MLNKSLKSEEDKRIESILTRLSSIGYNPDDVKVVEDLDRALAQIGYTYELLCNSESAQVVEQISRFHFNASAMEALADQFVLWGKTDARFNLHAKALYGYVQNNSGVFSMGIMQKMAQL